MTEYESGLFCGDSAGRSSDVWGRASGQTRTWSLGAAGGDSSAGGGSKSPADRAIHGRTFGSGVSVCGGAESQSR